MAVLEMGKYLRQIVDNPLEEGQFENAISVLDQLRSPDHTPSAIHLLHLIFIALHPASQSYRLDHPSALDPLLDNDDLIRQSPRKIVKQAKATLRLPPAAVVAAQNLLHSFLRTNGPAALIPALPTYPETRNPQQPDYEFVDSPIYNQAIAIKNSRTVWEILKSGFVNKSMTMFGTPKGRGKQSKGSALSRDNSFALSINEWEAQVEVKPVGEDAWPVLEWLVALFEAESEIAENAGQPRHSPLLLKQLPPPSLGSTTRWDALEPLKVVFYALQQTDERRQQTGLRLFHLLIDLTQTPYLDLRSFTATVLSQLAASCSSSSFNSQLPSPNPSMPSTPPRTSPGSTTLPGHRYTTHKEAITSLFTHLSPSPSPTCLAFRVSLCRKVLSDLDGGGGEQEMGLVNGNSAKPVSGFGGSTLNTISENGVASNSTGASGGNTEPQAVKPRTRPAPRPRARPAAQGQAPAQEAPAEQTNGATTNATTSSLPNGVPPPTPLTSTTSTDSTATSGAPPPPPAPVEVKKAPLPSLPPLRDITRLLYLPPPTLSSISPSQLQPPASRKPPNRTSGGRAGTRRSSRSRSVTPSPLTLSNGILNSSPEGSMGGGGVSLALNAHPWTSPPALLMRVKFELLSAWIGLRGVRRERARGEGGKLEGEGDMKDLEKVIEDVFGGGNGGAGERDEDREERLFYRELLRAMCGLPVEV